MMPGHLCLLIAAVLFPSASWADEKVEFSTDILKDRGLDASLGDYFADAAKFTPGRKRVSLKVNGKEKGTVTARFGKTGELCVDRDFLQSAGLRVPASLKNQSNEDEDESKTQAAACVEYTKDYPSAVVTALPGEEALEIVVPQEALATDDEDFTSYARGGNAGMMNYSIFTSQNTVGGDNSLYSQASLEEGLNVGDWLLRSRQIASKSDGQTSTSYLYTYVQHTFVDSKKMMQAGQINIGNTLFVGSAINGVQLVPESGLTGNEGSGVSVSGIAQSPQARVEVRQSGMLVYSTLVPAGPFTLTNVPVTQVNTALDITVTETSGSVNHYVIPAEAVRGNQVSGPLGLSMAAGQVRDSSGPYAEPMLFTATDGWRLTPWLNASAGVMTAQKYNAIAASSDVMPINNLMVSGVAKASTDSYGNNRGQSSTLSANYRLSRNINLSASATRYTQGYRELQDALQPDFVQNSGQYTTGIGWSTPLLGSFSLGYSLSKGSQGYSDSRYVNASWGQTFKWASVTVNWQSQLNQSQSTNKSSSNGDTLYVNVTIPLGHQRVNTYMHKQGDSTKTGIQTGGYLTDDTSYTVAAERDMQEGDNGFNGSINSNLHYTQLSAAVGTYSSGNRNYNATLSGGIAATDGAVVFSPYTVSDTFAVAKIDANVSGIQLSTPAGTVWTDRWGRALVPTLPAYQNARVEIDSETLPKNIDVNNGLNMVKAGHGSVSKLNFGVMKVRRAMLKVTMKDGKRLSKGATIVDQDGNYTATVVDEGLVFINDADQQPKLYVLNENDQKQCEIIYHLKEQRDENALFENTAGVCQ